MTSALTCSRCAAVHKLEPGVVFIASLVCRVCENVIVRAPRGFTVRQEQDGALVLERREP